MSKLVKKTNGKLRVANVEDFEARIAAEFENGTKLPKVIAALDSETKKKTIHLVSPVFWRLDGESRPFSDEIRNDPKALRAEIRRARKAGDRREVVAARAGISVAAVAKAEGKRPIYSGRGTKSHLVTA